MWSAIAYLNKQTRYYGNLIFAPIPLQIEFTTYRPNGPKRHSGAGENGAAERQVTTFGLR